MKYILKFLPVLFVSICFSQIENFKFPKIKTIGRDKTDFIPNDWIIRNSVSCDFNKDGLNDIAIVIQTKKQLFLKNNSCFSTEPFFPKILIILFRQSDNSLRLSINTTKIFGNCNWGVQGSDPFEEINIRRNTLAISFFTGGTTRNNITYYYRFQNQDWYLIGAESSVYWAGHTEGKDAFYNEAVNFLTGGKETYSQDKYGNKNSFKQTKLKQKPLTKLVESEIDITFGMSDE